MNQRTPDDLRFLSAVDIMDRFLIALGLVAVAGVGIICAFLLCWLIEVLAS